MPSEPPRPVVVITGAEGGIGSALAVRLSRSGFDLILGHFPGLVSPEWEKCETDWMAVPVDVRDADSIQNMVAAGRRRFGRLTSLVMLAGVIDSTPFSDMSIDEWQRMLSINLTGVFLTCAAAREDIVASRGCIVTTSSQVAYTGADGNVGYVAAKAGVVGLTRALARELAPAVRVNCVAPGAIETPMTQDQATPEWVAAKSRAVALGRIGRASEVAETIAWLLSPASAYVTGQTIHVNGGGFVGS